MVRFATLARRPIEHCGVGEDCCIHGHALCRVKLVGA